MTANLQDFKNLGDLKYLVRQFANLSDDEKISPSFDILL